MRASATGYRQLPVGRLLLAIVLALSVVIASPGSADAAQDLDAEQQFVQLINADRRAAGLGTLTAAKDVRDVAYAWSTRMASERRMYHNPDYASQMCCWRGAAENVGWTTVSDPNDPAVVAEAVQRLHDAFMDSPGHRANIMNSTYNHFGVGVELRENSCPSGTFWSTCLWATENFRAWDGTQPPGGLKDPYAAKVTVSDEVRPGGFDGDVRTVERLGSRASAALQVSQARFADGAAHHALVSRDDVFVDALAGAPLSADGPMLFVPTARLTREVRDELTRTLPIGGTVYILGGENSVSPRVETAIATAGLRPVRLAGPNRIATSAVIASKVRELYGDTGSVAIARAWGPSTDPNGPAGWVDSITGGAWAARRGVPVLVSASNDLSAEAAQWIAADGPASTMLFGGEGALGAKVAARVPGARRISGKDRSATAAAVAERLWGITPGIGKNRFLAIDGWARDGWQAGLVAAGLAADTGAPVLLVSADARVRPSATRSLAARCGSPSVDVLLLGHLGDDVAAWLEGIDGAAC